MRAVVCSGGTLTVEQVPDPVPGPGQVLLRVLRAGICGSDLHARHHADAVAELAGRTGYDGFMRSTERVILGHEFVGEVVGYGPGCRERWRTGTRVVALPLLGGAGGAQLIGLSESAPGAYATHVLVQESLAIAVPEALGTEVAALTEPLAVAHHAVRRAEIGRGPALVIGCGPIGLALILMLKAAGVRSVIASDFVPHRRALAKRCGADIVVDPAKRSPWDSYTPRGEFRRLADYLQLGITATERLRRFPGIPWARAIRLGELIGATGSAPVVFECVGIPGMINTILTDAPLRTRVVVVGVCMESDRISPALAINKEIDLRFVFGYDPGEFHDTLRMLATGKLDPRPLVTGTVGLNGVANAFTALADPHAHAKILIDPDSIVDRA